jgi:putative SOS response-associated peptidase YedK
MRARRAQGKLDDMCARYSAKTPMDAILGALGIPFGDTPAARTEVRPTEDAPIITATDAPRVELVHWGLFGEQKEGGKKRAPLINVRVESLDTRPQFTRLFASQRCIALADGFYEWMPGETPKAKKRPFRIRASDGGPIAIAGLYAGGVGTPRSFALLTTEANEVVSPIHDRMPVIIPIARLREFLTTREVTPAVLRSLLGPAARDALVAEPFTFEAREPAPGTPRKSAEEIAQLALFGGKD